MGKYLKISLVTIAIAALGYGFGRFTAPSKVIEIEKIRTIEIEKIVEIEKEVIKEVTVENKNINTTTTITEYPDGRKETVITVVDLTTIGIEKDTEKDTERDMEKDTTSSIDKTKITIYKKTQWKLTGLAGFELGNWTTPVYGALIEKRILGPIYVGGWALSNKTIGVGLSFEF